MTDTPHHHDYLLNDAALAVNERKTYWVVLITAVMMVVEIAAGLATKSMALLADGWHMASHAGALGIALLAYRLAKAPALSRRFSFGAGKFIPLGGYTSALILAMVAVAMIYESLLRLIEPTNIRFNEAIVVATLGLIVNLICAAILSRDSHSHHDHDHSHGHHHHDHHGHDHNFAAAYLHVLADAFTSVLAILALVVGKYSGWIWMDAVTGLVGAVVILKWAYSLCRETAWELLDGHARHISQDEIKARLECEDAVVSDLHVWRIAPCAHACELVIHSQRLKGVAFYKKILEEDFNIQHVVIEEHAA